MPAAPAPLPPVVAFGGARRPRASSRALAAELAAAVLAAGCRVAVGCCVGIDAAVIRSALVAAPRRLSVFAQFGPAPAFPGALRHLSAVPQVRAALAAGAHVQFWAGQPPRPAQLSVPVRARLALRSSAVVGAAGALLLVQPGPGSLGPAFAAARRRGLPVFAFGCRRPPGAFWVRAVLLGRRCWRWLPPVQRALF